MVAGGLKQFMRIVRRIQYISPTLLPVAGVIFRQTADAHNLEVSAPRCGQLPAPNALYQKTLANQNNLL
jgi:hypothetical protein